MKKSDASRIYRIMGFITSLANATMFTTYAIYQVVALGFNPLQLLMVGMVLEVTVLAFEGVTGVVADTYSRKTSVIVGMFVLGAGFVLEGSAMWLGDGGAALSAYAWLLIAQVVFGIGFTFVSGADSAWMVDEVGEERAGGVFLKAKRVGLIGTLLGIGLSVAVSTVGYNLPYIVGGLMYLSLGAFLIVYMKETNFTRPEKAEGRFSHWRSMKTTWMAGARTVRGNRILLMILIVTLFSGAASEGYDRLWQAFVIGDIGFPAAIRFNMATWFGLIALASTLLSLAAVWAAEKRWNIAGERFARRSLIVLTAARVLGIAGLALSPDFAYALSAVLLIEVVTALTGPVYDTWLNLNIESRSRATVLSMLSQSDALGQTAGGPFVGWIGSRLSVRASLLASAALLVPILAVFAQSRDRQTDDAAGKPNRP